MEKLDFNSVIGKCITLPGCNDYNNKPFYFKVKSLYFPYNRAVAMVQSTANVMFIASFPELETACTNAFNGSPIKEFYYP